MGNLATAGTPQATATFTYDARDQLQNLDRSNGVSTSYTYDPVGRALSLTHTNGSGVLNTHTYTNDAVGNQTAYTTDLAQPLITQPVTNLYDNDNRLLESGPTTLTYDNNGNLASKVSPTGTTTYTWDARNRLALLS